MIADSLPKLVLLPGLDGTGRLFEPICDALAGSFDTCVVQYPSDKPVGRTELANAVREQLPENDPYWILGESFGGPLAIEMAAQDQHHRCQGLILSATFVKNPHPVLSTFYPVVRRMPITPTIRGQIVRTVLGRYHTENLEQMLENATQQVEDHVFHSRIEQVIQTDASLAMREVHQRGIPVLNLTARNDWVVPSKASQEIDAICPTCERRSFDAPHVLLQAAAGEAASAISDFIADVRSGNHASGERTNRP
jgi:pimeloyl-ACP methyl ester carboxylesterase